MTILHYFLGFPPLHSGGLMVYATDLAKLQLELGHNVILLMPGIYLRSSSRSKIKFYKFKEGLPIYQIVNPQPVSSSGINNPERFIEEKTNNNYKYFLKKNNIEIIHIHSLMGFPIELMDEAKKLNIKIIFTTHDYFGLCPKVDFFKYNGRICDDYDEGRECCLCNCYVSDNNYLKRNLKLLIDRYPLLNVLSKLVLYLLKEIKSNTLKLASENIDYERVKIDERKKMGFVNFRNYYKKILENVDVILFNSDVTKNEYRKYIDLDKVKHKVLLISHSKIKDRRKVIRYKYIINGKVNFLFLGYLNEKKGFFDLVNILNEVKEKYTNWQLNIYGDYSNIHIGKFDKRFFKFYGKYKYENLTNIFSNSSVLIIPSIWKETFGFVGLEAYSYGIPVLVSENAGFSNLIKNGINGLIFSNKEDLKEKIIEILKNPQLLLKFHQGILNDEFRHSLEEHTKKIIDLYEEIIGSSLKNIPEE